MAFVLIGAVQIAAALLITARFSAHTRRRKKTKENTE